MAETDSIFQSNSSNANDIPTNVKIYPHRSKKLIIPVIAAMLVILSSGIYFYIQSKNNSDSQSALNFSNKTPQTSEAVITPRVETTQILSELIKGRSKVEIDVKAKYQQNQSTITNIESVKIPGVKQSSFPFFKLVHAAERTMIEVPKVIFQQITEAKAQEIAQKFGFSSGPKRPDQDPRILRWESDTRKLIIDTYSINFEQYLGGTNVPAFEDAKQFARNYLNELGYLPEEYATYHTFPETDEVYIYASSFDSESPYYQTSVKANSVGFVSKYNNVSVSRGDISVKFYDNEIDAYPTNEVWVGSEGTVVRASISKNLDVEKGELYAQKTLEQAIADIKTTGGVFMNAEYREPQKNNSHCFGEGNSCSVTDVVIENAKLVYYIPSGPSRPYDDDENPHHIGYMIPMWIFDGEGSMLRTVDGKESYGTPVRFIAGVYAIKGNQEESIIKINNFMVEKQDATNISVKFDFAFNVEPFFNGQPNPRQGIDYSMLVLYPDNTYSEYRSVIYDA